MMEVALARGERLRVPETIRKQRDKTRGERYRATQRFAKTRAEYEASEQGKANRRRGYLSPKAKEAARRRRALLAGSDSCLTEAQWQAIVGLWGCCAYCLEQTKVTQDHIVPISKQGSGDAWNVVPACPRCNSAKHVSDVEVFLRRKGRDSVQFWDRVREVAHAIEMMEAA